MACADRRSNLGRCDPRPAGAQRLSDRTERRIDAQTRNEIDGNRDFRLTMQTCVAALRLPVRMSVERVSGCWWTECPDGVESAMGARHCWLKDDVREFLRACRDGENKVLKVGRKRHAPPTLIKSQV